MKMKTMFKNSLWFTVIATLCLVVVALAANGCDDSDIPPEDCNNVSFTPCQQNDLKSSGLSDKVDVKFTDKGVQIMYNHFEVACDFTTVNVTHTFVNGVLRISQKGSPNQANCICYTDVSYTIDGVSQDEVNVIFINDVQVYCHNENYPIETPFVSYSLANTSCQWIDLAYNNMVVIINSNEELNQYATCMSNDYPTIDFSKYTLLLAHGKAPSSVINANCNSLQQFSEKNYKMNVNISIGYATVISNWQVPIVINKLDEGCAIELIVSLK